MGTTGVRFPVEEWVWQGKVKELRKGSTDLQAAAGMGHFERQRAKSGQQSRNISSLQRLRLTALPFQDRSSHGKGLITGTFHSHHVYFPKVGKLCGHGV